MGEAIKFSGDVNAFKKNVKSMAEMLRILRHEEEIYEEKSKKEGALEQTFTLLKRVMKRRNCSVAVAMDYLSLTEEERRLLASEYDLENLDF